MPLVTSLICPICRELFNVSSKRPRIGKCNHLICDECLNKENSSTCQICKKEDAFQVVHDYQLVSMLSWFEENLTRAMFDKISGSCFGCDSDGELKRLCVTCCEKSGSLRKLSNGSLRIIGGNSLINYIRSCFICSTCVLDKHKDHECIQIPQMKIIDEDIKIWDLLVKAMISERQIKEIKGENYQYLKGKIVEFRQEAIELFVFLKVPNIDSIKKRIKLTDFFLNIDQITELTEAKEKSFQIAKGIIEENLKLRERILIHKKKEISEFVELLKEKTNNFENDEELNEIFIQLNEIKNEFESMKIIDLFGEELKKEMDKIDEKVAEKMEELELIQKKIEPIHAEDCLKFFKFRALKKEIEEVNESLNEIEKRLENEVESFDSFSLKRLESIYKTNNEISSNENLLSAASKLFLFEITDRSLRVDRLIIERLEGTRKDLMSRLMYYQLFPDTIGRSYEDDMFLRLFIHFCGKTYEKSWIHQLFIAKT